MNLKDLRRYLKNEYEGIPSKKRAEEELLLMTLLEKDLSFLHAYPDYEVPSGILKKMEKILLGRKKGVPLEYLLGVAHFYGRDFYVDQRVLIPRPETELSVERMLKAVRDEKVQRILEIGVGSGVVSITLDLETKAKVWGVDISRDALEVATYNKQRWDSQVIFLESDLFQNVSGTYDLIYSNPPYIETATYETLSPSVRDFEPRLALDGGTDGLYFYKKIIDESSRFLTEQGKLVFEIGYNQGDRLREYLKTHGFVPEKVIKDFSGYDRVLYARRM